MVSPLAGDDFEHVEKDSYNEDTTACTDDEYEFVEAPVEKHAALPAAHAQPVGDGGRGNQAFPLLRPETLRGCDQGHHTKTIVPLTSRHGAVAPTRSALPPQNAQAKEEKMASQFSFYDVAAALDETPPGMLHDLVDMTGVAKLNATPVAHNGGAVSPPPICSPVAHGADDGEADQDDEDTDEDDGLYESCYDFADFGRSRRVKRSSGRRGRTKKATTMGRPRGEERSSHIAGNH